MEEPAAVEHSDHSQRYDGRRSLVECFRNIFQEGILTDVTFHVGEDKVELNAHKLVLSARSTVFFAMFNGSFESKDVVDIEDSEADEFKLFLSFLYTDEIELSKDNVVRILHLADKYNVILLFENCVQFLGENLNIDNACAVFAAAKKYNSESLKVLAMDFICLHAKDCLTTNAFLQLNNDDVEDISGCEGLSCREETLFECLDKWADEKCREKEIDLTDENKRAVLGRVLFTVRFPLMKYEYIVSKVSKRRICTETEMIQILQNHVAATENETSDARDDYTSNFINIARKQLRYEAAVLVQEGKYELELTDLSEELKITTFSMDTDTWFYGIMIYGPKTVMRFCVEIILEDECLHSEIARESVFVNAEINNYTCNVAMSAPVYLVGSRTYTCTFNIFTSSESKFFRLHESYEQGPKSKQPQMLEGMFKFNAPPVSKRTEVTEIVVAHHDTFVERKSAPFMIKEGCTQVKSFRHKKITVSDRSNMLAGLLLF